MTKDVSPVGGPVQISSRPAQLSTQDVGFGAYRYVIDHVRPYVPVHLVPFGDMHEDCGGFSEDKWLEFEEKYKNRKDCFFLGMGDYQDFMSPSEREETARAKLHEQSRGKLRRFCQSETERLFDQRLKWMKGRIIGLIEGHHFGEVQLRAYSDIITSTQYLAQLMECKYLDFCHGIRLTLMRAGTTTTQTLDIWANHGHGAARLIGGSLSRVQQDAEKCRGDIFLQGHDHKRGAAPVDILAMREKPGGLHELEVVAKQMYFVRTGSFLRGYVPGYRTYVMAKGMNPTNLGVVDISLTWVRRTSRHGESRSEESRMEISCTT